MDFLRLAFILADLASAFLVGRLLRAFLNDTPARMCSKHIPPSRRSGASSDVLILVTPLNFGKFGDFFGDAVRTGVGVLACFWLAAAIAAATAATASAAALFLVSSSSFFDSDFIGVCEFSRVLRKAASSSIACRRRRISCSKNCNRVVVVTSSAF